MNIFKVGLDVGSTTAKMVAVDDSGQIIFSKYERHHADVKTAVRTLFGQLLAVVGECKIGLTITGSAGMGLSERFSIPFEQEVVAVSNLIKKKFSNISTVIDIGGEDAKVIYFSDRGVPDMRMNGNCAGGTGAFIDQMSILLDCSIEEMNSLALQAEHVYPIASRCGVFSKTDVQNLVSKNVSKADIAASIFHAIAVQTVVTLSHGCSINPRVLFCGGPLTFIPALRNAFINYLHLNEDDYVILDNSNLLPAWGAALADRTEAEPVVLSGFLEFLQKEEKGLDLKIDNRLEAIFSNDQDVKEWHEQKNKKQIKSTPLKDHKGYCYLGIDSGSTTTKITLIDEAGNLLYSYYAPNQGNSIQAVRNGLSELLAKSHEAGVDLQIKGSCSTGYGEDLIKAAFGLDYGVIETIAHYLSAKTMDPEVSFILDIGGQDMKAMFIENGALYRMEINEACSSGCGSFIETFAKSLNYTVQDFAKIACTAKYPCDLGTRCTVFMNSKVKQFLREGATVADISAGLSYSVVKNCLYKVLKLKNTTELGRHIVVQGGTMRNDSVVRAFENLIGLEVHRSNLPELMGAYGCALFSKSMQSQTKVVKLQDLLQAAQYTARQINCRGCENVCLINKYTFDNGNIYYSGNKCEKIFSNGAAAQVRGTNLYTDKYDKIFNRPRLSGDASKPVVGIPRILNMFENYPFWNALFNECGVQTYLSEPSTFKKYEEGVHSVMSDNICFPAKLVHSHIYDLMEKGVDRIFFPYVVYERQENAKAVNSYNCPIVSGYSDVVKSAIGPLESYNIPVDSPNITFKDEKLLKKNCIVYFKTLGVSDKQVCRAVDKALAAQLRYEEEMREANELLYKKSCEEGRLSILLAGRPYHSDPLVQHKLSDMIADLGVNVLTEDITRNNDSIDVDRETHMISQWAYINRITKAAKWVATEGANIHFMQMTSFGCGPDAFLLDEIANILKRHNKSLTILKLDDVSNIGSIKLRVRSLIESLKYSGAKSGAIKPFVTTKVYRKEDKKKRKIIAPFFTDYLSPFVPTILKLSGFEVDQLPKSDIESAETGLKYANNEVCYPATLVVGDIIKAVQSGKYDPENTAVAITQTGGQCRATNYIALIKNGLVDAGYPQIPVVALAFGGLSNEQSGFDINWFKIIKITLTAILFGDCLSQFYHASVVREKSRGQAQKLRDYYIEAANQRIAANDSKGLLQLLATAAADFNGIVNDDDSYQKVGIVGEIYLKFHSFANRDVINWLIENKIEVCPPMLSNFFLQTFVNRKYSKESNLERSGLPDWLMKKIYKLTYKYVNKVNEASSAFRYFVPLPDIFEESEHAKGIVSLTAQFGEGWLLPAEVVSYAKQNVNNVVSLQPFGCIANHIVAKGVEKKIKTLYPRMNLLSLDYDSGVSDVNIVNRLHLMINNLK
ncbi:putative CoA-substrate-specific enzyme activase [Dysgonomonas sp. PH5-45]|uniref:acyl-CoA dehydratase activase-related protein n=1 Tax=unclassified Dysgonomonas TaxID=2630389 RepID=UPI002477178D|nr:MULTISPECIES: acyl-CoA dehydratase activase-related protein [unclassified Dysgonomonas]MDH6355256.1 putative CoA-substrate-specific enzyme activase [Dysgonomonas sp. PH5-45]MDH6388122.1 putative CoA-substrate-specific enzyme activase [Dysgonomonas sp. PH5-37]